VKPAVQTTTYTEIPCMTCEVNPLEHTDYPCRFYRKKLRPMLARLVGNLYKCPQCGAVYYDRDFYTP